MDEVRVLEIEALADAAEFDVLMADEAFEGDFLAAVGEAEVDFAETARADAAFDGVAGQRLVSAAVGEGHGDSLRGSLATDETRMEFTSVSSPRSAFRA